MPALSNVRSAATVNTSDQTALVALEFNDIDKLPFLRGSHELGLFVFWLHFAEALEAKIGIYLCNSSAHYPGRHVGSWGTKGKPATSSFARSDAPDSRHMGEKKKKNAGCRSPWILSNRSSRPELVL